MQANVNKRCSNICYIFHQLFGKEVLIYFGSKFSVHACLLTVTSLYARNEIQYFIKI